MTLRQTLLAWWGRRHIGEVIRRRALRRELRRLLAHDAQDAHAAGRVLDVGCGRGDNARWCARRTAFSVDAIDIDAAVVAIAQRSTRTDRIPNLHVRQADAEQLPPHREGGARYAIIYSVDVFEHLQRPQETLRALATALEPDGAILLHVPRAHQRRWFKRFDRYDQHDHARDGFEPQDLADLAASAGLRIVHTRHTFGTPGALAWELFQLAQGVGKWAALAIYPVIWPLALLDGLLPKTRGNGILIRMQHDHEQSSSSPPNTPCLPAVASA